MRKNLIIIIVIVLISGLFSSCIIINNILTQSSEKKFDNIDNNEDIVNEEIDLVDVINIKYNCTSQTINEINSHEKEEKIWIEKLDYTTMTRSKIEKRISSLLALINVMEEWPTLSPICEQAIIEFDRAMACLEENNYLYPYSDEDLILLSYMIYIEAGASFTTDEEQCLVASVIINRRNQGGINKNLHNPTIKDIINENGQYAICRYNKRLRKNSFYVDLNSIDLTIVSDRCKENARKVLENEFSCPENVVFQALFVQGEVYKEFYHKELNNTTYFCYGDTK